MRVIAGMYRSRLLESPRGEETRPTSDRLRETLFNILAPRIEGSRFVDLYAGTGAVGIEAISRGASYVWFAENAAPALTVLKKNLKTLNVAAGYTLEDRSSAALLERMVKQAHGEAKGAAQQAALDLVYLDPPWEAEQEYARTLQLLGSARGSKLLAPGALVVAEHSRKNPLAAKIGALVQTRTLLQGDAALSFYSVGE